MVGKVKQAVEKVVNKVEQVAKKMRNEVAAVRERVCLGPQLAVFN